MGIGKDPLKIVKVEDCITSNLFSQHAFENHTNAAALFSKDVGNELRTDLKIEPLEENYFLEISNAKENTDIDSTEKTIKKCKIKTKQESTIKEQVLGEICPILDVKTSSLKSINSHRTKNDKKGKQFCCPYCDKKDIHWITLLRHVSLNHQEHYEKKFFCNICDKGFLFSSLYTKHKNVAHAEKEKIHICYICGNHYKEMYRLQQHILSKHNSEGATKLFCEKCGYSTVSKMKLREHIYRRRNTENHKKCQFCEYTSPCNLKLHIHIDNNHPEKEVKNFLCEKCNRSFIYEASFTDDTKYKYKYSDYSEKGKEQKTKSNMKATKNKLFQCDYCEEVIKTKRSNMIIGHYNLHHSGKPIIEENHENFPCLNCNDVFLFEDEFNCHINLVHGIKTEKNHCPKCKLSYVENHTCQMDNRGIGSNPYDKCDKTFSSRQYLIGHLKTEHDKQLDFECSTCGKKVG